MEERGGAKNKEPGFRKGRLGDGGGRRLTIKD